MTALHLIENSNGPLAEREENATLLFAVPDTQKDQDEYWAAPKTVREDVEYLLSAFEIVIDSKSQIKALKDLAVDCAERGRGFKLGSLRRKFFAYKATGDWRVVADKAKAVKLAKNNKRVGLPASFVKVLRKFITSNKKKNLPAFRKMRDRWKKGDSFDGYGTWKDFFAKKFPELAVPPVFPDLYPDGWSDRNLNRYAPTKAQEKMAREGFAASRAHLPYIHGTRDGLKFLEEVQFDDLKTDFRILDPERKQICDLWLLIARDRATDLILGYGMRPALAREDGTQEHLKHDDMKQLSGWLLQRFGLPPYVCHWKIENGAATFTDAFAKAIEQLSGGLIVPSFARMIGGTVMPGGFKDRAIGNSKSKANLEAGNYLIHTEAGDLPGQTGSEYKRRPAELAAREAECRELFKLAEKLGPLKYSQVEFPMLTLWQARENLNEIFHRINSRNKHKLEGFEDVILWRDRESEPWKKPAELPIGHTPVFINPVKESPYERMVRLVRGYEFRRIHPSFFTHFFDSSHKFVNVNERGEIEFDWQGKTFQFFCPGNGFKAGTQFLGYFHPREVDFLHLTQLAPHHGYVATWARKPRNRSNDAAALAEAMSYTQGALKSQADELRSWHPDAKEIEDGRRARNAALADEEHNIITVATVPESRDGLIDNQFLSTLNRASSATAEKRKRNDAMRNVDAAVEQLKKDLPDDDGKTVVGEHDWVG